jgi:hypothetical protein
MWRQWCHETSDCYSRQQRTLHTHSQIFSSIHVNESLNSQRQRKFMTNTEFPLPGFFYWNPGQPGTLLHLKPVGILTINLKNGVFWDVTPCGFCKNRRFGGTWCLLHQGDKNRWTRNTTSSPILVTLMKEAPGSSETSVITRATRRWHPRRHNSS